MSSLNSLDTTTPLIEPEGQPRPGTLVLLMTLVSYVAGRAREKARFALARRRLERTRRTPTALTTALRSARQVLVVCHGNIIRSAFAAQLLQQTLGASGRVRCASAGMEAMPGRPAHPIALRIAARRRVDLSHHTAARISAGDVRISDVVFAVDVPEYVALRSRFPDARHKIFLLTCLAPATPLEIADPVYGDDHAFEVCFDHITRAIDPIGRVIVGPHTVDAHPEALARPESVRRPS